MAEWFQNLSPVIQTLIGTLFTWGVTALGASFVFFFKEINQKVLTGMLGFAAGVMIAASFWSLLNPAIEMANELNIIEWVPALVGFLGGGLFLLVINKILPLFNIGQRYNEQDGITSTWRRSILLVLSITLHNIPEGLAVGVAFGAVAAGSNTATIAGAVALAFGIGIQNFPEGAAVSIPLRREGMSRRKSFFYGQASGIVEPIAGVIGAFAVMTMQPILPYALAFAAGAMIFVVIEELIPEAQINKTSKIATIGTILGFAVMMLLDVALG